MSRLLVRSWSQFRSTIRLITSRLLERIRTQPLLPRNWYRPLATLHLMSLLLKRSVAEQVLCQHKGRRMCLSVKLVGKGIRCCVCLYEAGWIGRNRAFYFWETGAKIPPGDTTQFYVPHYYFDCALKMDIIH